jgi:hypothetical protein
MASKEACEVCQSAKNHKHILYLNIAEPDWVPMIAPLSKTLLIVSRRLALTVIPSQFSFLLLFFSADDLRQGLEDRPRWAHARLFHDWAVETLHILKVRVTWCSASPSEGTGH